MSSILLRKAPILNDIVTLKTTNNRKILLKVDGIYDNPNLKYRKYYGVNVRNTRHVYSFILWTDCNEVNNIRLCIQKL
jgi:hypothetical protein